MRPGAKPHPAHTFVVVLAAAAVLAACQQDDSILVVEVGGDLNLRPAQLIVTVAAGGRSKTFPVPDTPAPFYLPTSFTVELDRSITGPVMVTVAVLDDVGDVLALGATTQRYINTGGQTLIAVTVTNEAPP